MFLDAMYEACPQVCAMREHADHHWIVTHYFMVKSDDLAVSWGACDSVPEVADLIERAAKKYGYAANISEPIKRAVVSGDPVALQRLTLPDLQLWQRHNGELLGVRDDFWEIINTLTGHHHPTLMQGGHRDALIEFTDGNGEILAYLMPNRIDNPRPEFEVSDA